MVQTLKKLASSWREKAKVDACSPNGVLLSVSIAVFCAAILCGQSLWIPASRIGNLHVRSVALALSDCMAALASSSALDLAVPSLREDFISMSGLAGNQSWDSRYYNRRLAPSSDDQILPDPAASTVTATAVPVSATAVSVSTAPDSPILQGAASQFPDQPVSALTSGSAMLAAGISRAPAMRAHAIIHSAKEPLRVFMFGDSQVFSLGSGLSRIAGKDSPVAIEFLPIHSSGFIRGDYYNWPAKLEDTFRAASYEAAVMMLGMNDYQSFWNRRGEILRKGTPEWEAAYKDKCRELIDISLASVPRVYWLGMPAVKNRGYDDSLAYIDRVQASLAEEYSPDILVRISLRDTIPGAGKTYTDSVDLGDGRMLRVMGDDGSHFTVEGGQLVMKPLFDRLSRDYLFSEVPVAHLPE